MLDGCEILHHTNVKVCVVYTRFFDRDTHRKQGAIFAHTCHHTRLIHQAFTTGLRIGFEVAIVRLTLLALHQRVDVLPFQGLLRKTKNLCSGQVALHDTPVRISHHNGLWHRGKNAVELAFAQP